MLQRSVLPQLARIGESRRAFAKFPGFKAEGTRKVKALSTTSPAPMSIALKAAARTMEILGPDEKHWFAGGARGSGVAIKILQENGVIAVPTDTIYGFAALAQSNRAVLELYSVKGRAKTKPLAIALCSITDIPEWAEIDHIPPRLLEDLLPGPVTVVLKRTKKLNPALNPGHETVGIRIPRTKFIRHICRVLGEPLALTSANLSNEPSTLHPDEFKPLWPQLGAVFYESPFPNAYAETQRLGSTVVDLTVPGEFEIIRPGMRFSKDLEILNRFCMRRRSEQDATEDLVQRSTA